MISRDCSAAAWAASRSPWVEVGGGELVERGCAGAAELGRGVVAGGEVGEEGVGARQDQADGPGGDAGDRAQLLGEVEDQAVGGARRRA